MFQSALFLVKEDSRACLAADASPNEGGRGTHLRAERGIYAASILDGHETLANLERSFFANDEAA
jgi:hypothetical protein